MSFTKGLGEVGSAAYARDDRQGAVGEQRFRLRENTIHVMKQSGQTLYVVSGMAWVTFRGDTRDYFVKEGEEFVIRQGRGKAQVSALYGPLVFGVR